jgi:uncharacterized membrane protein
MTSRPKKVLNRIHWPGAIAALTTLAGILTLPEVLAILPAKYGVTLIGIGAAVQAVTKAVHTKGKE